jgi:hypothetical protein
MTKPVTRCTVWNTAEDWAIDLDVEATGSVTLDIGDDYATLLCKGLRAADIDEDLETCPVLASDANGVAYEGEIVSVDKRLSMTRPRLVLECDPASEGPLWTPTQGRLPSVSP